MSSDTFVNIFPESFTSVGVPGTVMITASQAIPARPPSAEKLILKLTGNLGVLPNLVAPSVGRGGLFTVPALYWSIDAGTPPLGIDTPVVNTNGTFALPNFAGFRIDNIGAATYMFHTRSPIVVVSGAYSIGLDGSSVQNTTYSLVGVEVRYQWGV